MALIIDFLRTDSIEFYLPRYSIKLLRNTVNAALSPYKVTTWNTFNLPVRKQSFK